MQKIFVSFRNKQDLETLEKKIGLKLSFNTLEVNFKTKNIKLKSNFIKTKKFEMTKEWENYWIDLPEVEKDFMIPSDYKITFLFDPSEHDKNFLSELFEQTITQKTNKIWFPKKNKTPYTLRFIGGENPKYPIYVISKGRARNANFHTSNALSKMELKHFLVVEPDEYDLYYSEFKDTYAEIIKLDMTYKKSYDCFSDLGAKESTGSGPARNFCWDHSISNGHKYHWILDDNISTFYRFYRGKRIICKSGETFKVVEDFVERFENVAISGLGYRAFCPDNEFKAPFSLNTRIYSSLFIRNDIPYRWRGRYNEDTDLSLRVLKDGWCTIQSYIFIACKATTQTIKGGNTDVLYKEGTYAKSKMLHDMHPDVVNLVERYGREHHFIDYSIFRTKLIPKSFINYDSNNKINERGLKLVNIPIEIIHTDKDTKSYIESLVENTDEYNVDKNIFLKENKINNLTDLF